MLVEIYCKIDDVCNQIFQHVEKQTLIGRNKSRNQSRMLPSEVMTIIVYYGHSHYKTFKQYYQNCVLQTLQSYFPKAVSYTRFLELRTQYLGLLKLVMKGLCSENTGVAIIDSTPLKACKLARAYRHKTMKGFATKGKSTEGWFYGSKAHLIINQFGGIVSAVITPGNISDANKNILEVLTRPITGKLIGDKGYIGRFEWLYKKGIELIHGIRANMKNKFMTLENKWLLRKRSLIETVNGLLKEKLGLEHSRHRSKEGFLAHILATLCAYAFYPKKPSMKMPKNMNLIS